MQMNNSSKKFTSLAFTGLVLALALTGCGGGSNDSNTSKPASADMIASFNSIAEACGEKIRLPATDSGETLSIGSSFIYSLNGSNTFPEKPELRVSIDDWRRIRAGFVRVSRGSGIVGEGMGVQMNPSLPSGGIACVKAVSKYKAPPVQIVLPGQQATAVEGTLSWASRDKPVLPIDSLGSFPIDGFELIGNFNLTSGVAFFRVPKTALADASVVQICSLPNGANTWNCSLPKVDAQTNSWIFYVDAAQPGTYMLTSSHPDVSL